MITIERNRRGEDSEKRQDGGHRGTLDKHIQINTLDWRSLSASLWSVGQLEHLHVNVFQCNTVAEKPAGLAAFTVFWKVLFC